jgi:hypothetical protein
MLIGCEGLGRVFKYPTYLNDTLLWHSHNSSRKSQKKATVQFTCLSFSLSLKTCLATQSWLSGRVAFSSGLFGVG